MQADNFEAHYRAAMGQASVTRDDLCTDSMDMDDLVLVIGGLIQAQLASALAMNRLADAIERGQSSPEGLRSAPAVNGAQYATQSGTPYG